MQCSSLNENQLKHLIQPFYFQTVPIALAAGVVIIVGVAVKVFFNYQSGKKKTPILLEDPVAKYSLPLVKKYVISHDTMCYRFGLPTPKHVLGLPIGQHIHLTAKIKDEIVIRSYTPISCDDDHGYVDLVVKVTINRRTKI